MSLDDDIRRTLRSEAHRYDPADDGWDGITAGVRAARSRRRRASGGILGAVAAAVVAVGAGIALSVPDDATDVDAGPFSTDPAATTPTSSGTAPSAGTTPPTQPAESEPAETGVFPGIWPFASQAAIDRYADGDASLEDPVATADAFARDYLGMLDPVVGPARPAGDGTVEVVLRPRGEDGAAVPDGGPSTTVTLRSYGTSYGASVWTVVGAASPHIVVTEPAAGAAISSPVAVRGEATGYEGTVVAHVRQDGMRAGARLGEAVGIAGSMGELGPLALDVRFGDPTEPTGALVVTTDTGLDEIGVPEATVVRVAFAQVASRPGGNAPGACTAPPAPATGEGTMAVVVHLVCDAAVAGDVDPGTDGAFVAVPRAVPRTAGVLRASLEALLAGTLPAEEDRGLSSMFSEDTAGLLGDVTIEGGTAIVDLTGTVANASTATGSALFQGQLSRTVLQFSTVARVEYRLDGSCDAFWEWQQVGGCRLVTRDDL